MKSILVITGLLVATATSVQANPWDDVPHTPPYKNLADAVKATTPTGQQSALNPSCQGMTGEACTKAAQSLNKTPPAQVQVEASNQQRPLRE